MSDYQAPPRCPDELLASDLPDWAKVVWLVVRAVQNNNGRAWADYEEYGRRCGKSHAMVRKGLEVLRREGWVEELEPAGRGRAPVLRCLWKGANPVPKGANGVRTIGAKGANPVPERCEQGSTPPTPPYKEESVKESVGRARAHAREASVEGAAPASPAAFDPVAEYRAAYPDVPLNWVQEAQLRHCADPDAFRAALEYWLGNDHLGRSVVKFVDRYRRIAAGEVTPSGARPEWAAASEAAGDPYPTYDPAEDRRADRRGALPRPR